MDIIQVISTSFSAAVPSILTALFFIVLGYIVGVVAKFIVVKFLGSIGVNEWFEQQNLLAAIGNKNFSEIVGTIIKWYIFFIFLKQAVELVNLVTLNEVLGLWITYAISVIIAVGIIIAGMVIGRYIRNAIETTNYMMKRLMAMVVEIVVVYIAIVMAIRLIGLPTMLLEWAFLIAFAGFVICASLIIGISFGFALKDDAKVIVSELKGSAKKK